MGRGSSAPGGCSRGHQRQPLPGAGSSQLSPQLVPPARGLGPSAAPASRRGGRVCAGGWELPLEPLRSAGWGSGLGFGVLRAAQPPLPHRSPPSPGQGWPQTLRRDPCPSAPHLPREAPVPSPTCVLCRGSRGGCGRVPGAGGAHPMERRGARCPARCGGGRGAGTASTPRILRSVGLATSSGRRMLGGAGAGLVLSPPPGQGVPEPPRASAGPGMGRAAAGTPRLLPSRGCPWDPQPTGELLLRGGSPEPPPLSPGSQEGTATGHRLHRAAAAAHSKGRAGNEPRPRRGLQAVQCHGHAVVALSLLSAQAGPSRLVREKNILFSPRKALPFHRASGSCPGNHRPRCGAGSPALLGTNCWEQRAGLGGSTWQGQVRFKGPKSGTV